MNILLTFVLHIMQKFIKFEDKSNTGNGLKDKCPTLCRYLFCLTFSSIPVLMPVKNVNVLMKGCFEKKTLYNGFSSVGFLKCKCRV